MNKSGSNISGIIIFTVGVIGVIVIIMYITSVDTFPSLKEFISTTASSTIETKDQKINSVAYATTTIKVPKGNIIVEIADTTDKVEQGLSNRISLDTNSGMLFVFPMPDSYPFWMKDMKFPIDIVWMNALKKVVGIDADISPDTYPKTFGSYDNIQYVLELNAGQAKRFGIVTGMILSF